MESKGDGKTSILKKKKRYTRDDKAWPDLTAIPDEDLASTVESYIFVVTRACQEALCSPRSQALDGTELEKFVKAHVLTILDSFRRDLESKAKPPILPSSKTSLLPPSSFTSLTDHTIDLTPIVRSHTAPELTAPRDKNEPLIEQSDASRSGQGTLKSDSNGASKPAGLMFRPGRFHTYMQPTNYTGIPPSFRLPHRRQQYFNPRWGNFTRNETDILDVDHPPALSLQEHEITKHSNHLLHKYYHCGRNREFEVFSWK